ncbi:MAG: ATP-binding protein [Candidatus Diapherotrites archaeon]|nr:ATP-binding protein [Candidatus Diapherotrites archaeon]
MNRMLIREYLLDFQERGLPDLIPRELKVSGKRIKAIVGPRRAGKTYFLFQKMKELMKESVLYLNFEDPRLSELEGKGIRGVLKIFWELFPESKNVHIFIDEPQNIPGWEKAVRALHDEGFDIYITGSSSKLLSKEIATSLRGRSSTYLLFPFSFREFLNARGVTEPEKLSSRKEAKVRSLLNEYLKYGGFPEVVLENNEREKLRILEEYLNLVVYRDIVERYRVRNVKLIRWLMNSLVANTGSELSVHKLYLTLKSQGMKVSKDTLYSYISMLEDSLFVLNLKRFSYSERKNALGITKSYINDVGFLELLGKEDIGRRLETVVFLELQRRKLPGMHISYWKDVSSEVDFVVSDRGKVKELIQVSSDLSSMETKTREMDGLVKVGKKLKCTNLKILTLDESSSEIYKGLGIKIIPVWRWLLGL